MKTGGAAAVWITMEIKSKFETSLQQKLQIK